MMIPMDGQMHSVLVAALRQLMADTSAVYQHAHGFHWNVKGPDFSQYHALFAAIYEDIYGSLDPTAECLLKIGEDAPFTASEFAALCSIDDMTTTDTPQSMTESLYMLNEALIRSTKTAFDAAIGCDNQGVANFLAGRLDQLAKWSWQLRVSAS